ncbi:MAG: WD40 repeat domain-containing protein, partial [Candidatus Zixiibacteriota bacterium]
DPNEGSLGSVNIVRLVLSIGLLLTVGLGGCSDKGPTGPTSQVDYSFYGIDNLDSRRVLRFQPSTGIIDTVGEDFPQLLRTNVSANGQLLYLDLADSVGVFDSESGALLRSLPYRSSVTAFSPDGKYVVLSKNGALRILRLPTYQLVLADDTSHFGGAVFSINSKDIYSVGVSSTGSGTSIKHLRICPMGTIEERSIPAMPGALIQVAPSIDQKLLFLYSRWDSFGCSFGVYDVHGDSLIYRTDFSPGGGWIVVSPDGRNVFFTNPGTLLIPPQPPPSAFYIYDIPSNTVHEVSTFGLAGDPSERDNMPVGPMAITPDGKTLVLARAVIGNDLVVFDVPSKRITKYCYFNNQAFFYDITCQTGR